MLCCSLKRQVASHESSASSRKSCGSVQHYDKLKGSQEGNGGGKSGTAKEGSNSGGGDISTLLAQEVAGLKDKSKVRFKIHNVDVKGCTFIIFPDDKAGERSSLISLAI